MPWLILWRSSRSSIKSVKMSRNLSRGHAISLSWMRVLHVTGVLGTWASRYRSSSSVFLLLSSRTLSSGVPFLRNLCMIALSPGVRNSVSICITF